MTTIAFAVALSLVRPVHASAWDRISGQDSAVEAPRTVWAGCEADWSKLWNSHQAGKPRVKALPAVDFTKETVVAVFLGTKSRGGWRVELDAQRDPLDRGRLNVIYREVAPGRTRPVVEMLSRPFVILKVPGRYSKVFFEVEQEFKIMEGAVSPEASQKLALIVDRLGDFARNADVFGVPAR